MHFTSGHINGKYIQWYSNGQKHIECEYVNNKKKMVNILNGMKMDKNMLSVNMQIIKKKMGIVLFGVMEVNNTLKVII